MAGDGAPPVYLARATPDSYWRKELATGAERKGFGYVDPARAWWNMGALIVDGDGAGLVDADGVRHPLPVPPWGGKLVLLEEAGAVSGAGGTGSLTRLFVTDEHDHVIVRLPHIGFEVPALQAFAAAAGLTYEHPVLRLGQPNRVYGNLDAAPTLEKAIHDEEQRSRSVRNRLRRLVHPAEQRRDLHRQAPGSTSTEQRPAVGDPSMPGVESGTSGDSSHTRFAPARLAPNPTADPSELTLHAAVAHAADDDLPYLVALHDGSTSRPPSGYTARVAEARAQPLTDIREVVLALQAGAGAILRSRFTEAQLPLPTYNGQNKGYRIRLALNLIDGSPRLAAAMDEHEAMLQTSDVAAPPGASSLPTWWTDTLTAASAPLRECLVIVAKANWAMPFGDPPPRRCLCVRHLS